jgi:outer membrane protein assembly factor BamB
VLIVNAADKQVLAFDANGNALWQVALAEMPVASPALNANGDVYVSDSKGGLTFIPRDAAQPGWRFQPESTQEATSGPIVARNGNIYYTVVNRIQAVKIYGAAGSLQIIIFISTRASALKRASSFYKTRP